jgi:hypothetical protein
MMLTHHNPARAHPDAIAVNFFRRRNIGENTAH